MMQCVFEEFLVARTAKEDDRYSIHLMKRNARVKRTLNPCDWSRQDSRQIGATVEHALAHIGHWQGNRARYMGCGKISSISASAVVHQPSMSGRLTVIKLLPPATNRNESNH
jgi:hypothetical protein